MRDRQIRGEKGFTLVELMIAIAIIAILAAILVPNFQRTRAQGQLTGCKSNLKSLATSIEMYSTNYSGRFCESLDQLVPNYLKTLPVCPAAGADTYSGSFESTTQPDTFVVICESEAHSVLGIMADFPRWNSESGLQEHPVP